MSAPELPPMRGPTPQMPPDLLFIAGALDDADKALAVLFSILKTFDLKEGAMVADEIAANVKAARKRVAHMAVAALSQRPAGAELHRWPPKDGECLVCRHRGVKMAMWKAGTDVQVCDTCYDAAMEAQGRAAPSSVPVPAEPQHRIDKYDELAEALGCDPMDSHEGRVVRARRLAAQPSVPAEGWIPVASGKLPPLDEMVLVYVPSAMHFKFDFDSWQVLREAPMPGLSSATIEVGEGWGDHNYEEVSHWMRLAAAPSLPTGSESAAG